jgi:hypothetical protein
MYRELHEWRSMKIFKLWEKLGKILKHANIEALYFEERRCATCNVHIRSWSIKRSATFT